MDQELKDILLSMQSEIRSIHTEMSEMKQTQQQQGQEITKINVTLENDVATRLQLLTEGQTGMNEQLQKLDQVSERVEDIQITVNAMEAVTKQNCTDIKQLRAIK